MEPDKNASEALSLPRASTDSNFAPTGRASKAAEMPPFYPGVNTPCPFHGLQFGERFYFDVFGEPLLVFKYLEVFVYQSRTDADLTSLFDSIELSRALIRNHFQHGIE